MYYRTIVLLVHILCASAVFADEGRFDILLESSLFSRVVESGDWAVTVAYTHIDYLCVECDGKVSARLDIVQVPEDVEYADLLKKIRADRIGFCAQLVQDDRGRCSDFRTISYRARTLRGFRSTHLEAGATVIGIVLPYNNRGLGPTEGLEIIRTRITIEDNATVPIAVDDFFWAQMLRLTLLY